eukprot:scaffold5271_cov23-Tisochrysis_lutea.AAC.1
MHVLQSTPTNLIPLGTQWKPRVALTAKFWIRESFLCLHSSSFQKKGSESVEVGDGPALGLVPGWTPPRQRGVPGWCPCGDGGLAPFLKQRV